MTGHTCRGIRRRNRCRRCDWRTLLIERGKILAHRPCGVSPIAQVDRLLAGGVTATIRVGFDHAGVDGKAFTTDQSFPHTSLDHTLEDMAKRFALPEAPMAVLRERGMVRYHVLKTQSTEPAVGQIEVNLFAQPSLGPNAEAVADDQHSNHQLRIDRGAACVTVEGREVLAQFAEIEESINPTQQVIGRNVSIEIE